MARYKIKVSCLCLCKVYLLDGSNYLSATPDHVKKAVDKMFKNNIDNIRLSDGSKIYLEIVEKERGVNNEY